MWKRILALFSINQSRKDFIAEILSDTSNQEALLGVRATQPPSPDQVDRDIDKMIRYARTDAYSVWAKEAWTEALKCMDKLTRNNLTGPEVDFYRGSLTAILDLLRISYIAQFTKEDSKNQHHGKNGTN